MTMIRWQDSNPNLDAIDEPSAPLREDIDPGALGDLADDMAVNGLLQPIGIRGPSPEGRHETIWGHRRLLAARALNWTTIPARICPWDTPVALARLAENMIRADLNPREEARAVAALRESGKPWAEIARILRRSISWVEARASLLSWPEDLQEAVARGTLPFSSARLLAEVDHEQYRADLINEAQRTGASSATISVWLAHYAADRERIIQNRETVQEILERRESFRVLFTCECCEQEDDTRNSVLLRVCTRCKRTLDQEKQEARQNGNGQPEK